MRLAARTSIKLRLEPAMGNPTLLARIKRAGANMCPIPNEETELTATSTGGLDEALLLLGMYILCLFVEPF